MSFRIKYELPNKALIFMICLLPEYYQQFNVKDIGLILVLIFCSLLLTYHQTLQIKITVLVVTIVTSILYPTYGLFFPVVLYDYIDINQRYTSVLYPLIGLIQLQINYGFKKELFVSFLVASLVAIYLNALSEKRIEVENDLTELEHSSREQQFILEKQNASLMEEQNLTLTLGISEERNRIARDIHDNVGHLLSSGLIQIGAVKVLNQQSVLVEPLNLLNGTIQEGMDNIRESVHDLYDDSLNFEQSLHHILEKFHKCPITLNYRLQPNLNNNLKIDFLMVIRESLANIIKHSNATLVMLEIVEQPGFYRLRIHDNGTVQNQKSPIERGIGLHSMTERLARQGGRLTVERKKDGFQLLGIVPKKEKGRK